MNATAPTLLTYAINTVPGPLTAGLTNGIITLLATNNGHAPVSLQGITVRIPVGTGANDLTDGPTQVHVQQPSGWKQNTPDQGPGYYTFVLDAPAGTTVPVGSALVIELENIQLNNAAGTAEIILTEGSAGYPTLNIPVSVFPSGWGTVTFSANPPDLAAAGDVSLTWSGPPDATYQIEYIDAATRDVVLIPAQGEPPLGNTGTYPGQLEPALSISATTTFTLTVTYGNLSTSPQQTVNVVLPNPVITSLTGSVTGPPGNPVLNILWTSQDALSVEGSWTPDSLDANPAVPAVLPFPFAASYQVTAVGSAGTQPGSATLSLTWALYSVIQTGLGTLNMAASPDGRYVLAANLFAGTVSVINTGTLAVQTTIAVGTSVSGIAFTPDSSQAWVVSTINSANTISVIDMNSLAVQSNIALTGNAEMALTFTADGKEAWVADYGSNSVIVIDTASQTVKATIEVGQLPSAIVLTPDGSQAWVPNFGSNSIAVIDTSSLAVQSTIAAGNNPFGIAITPDGKKAWMISEGDDSLTVIDVSGQTVESVTVLGGGLAGIAFTSDGKQAFVSQETGNTVLLIDTDSETVQSSITGLSYPGDIAVSSDHLFVFVANPPDSCVSVLSYSLPPETPPVATMV